MFTKLLVSIFEVQFYIMPFSKSDIDQSLVVLQGKLKELTAFYRQDLDFQIMVYPLWNAKDILGHLTFWHESFARNIKDLAIGVKPKPLKGKLSEVNAQSVEVTSTSSLQQLIQRIEVAQLTIEAFIYDSSIDTIPNKQGSRGYSRKEHLNVVSAHIARHLKDLTTKYKPYAQTKNQN